MSEPTLYQEAIAGDVMGAWLFVKPVELKPVGGTYEHPWQCHNCWTDHGGPGCDEPDFGEWHQWYEVVGAGIGDKDE